MPEPALQELAGWLELKDVDAGDVLLRQGGPADCMYLVVSGSLQVIDPDLPGRVLAELGPGDPVGEIALWTSEPRSATIRASTSARLARLTRQSFDRIAGGHPEAGEAVDRIVGRRLRQNQLSSALRVSKLFGDLEEAALRDLESELELVWIQGGQTLFRQGDPGDALYLVVTGKMRVLNEDAGDAQALAEIGRGGAVGEMALIDGQPRSATVVAARDSQLAKLSKSGFERLASGRQALLMILVRKLVSRARESAAGAKPHPPAVNAITVASLGPLKSASLDGFANRLSAAFSQIGRTVRVDGAALDIYAGKPGISQAGDSEAGNARVLDLLSKLETSHRYVIYQADAYASSWTSRCLRHSDQLVLIAEADSALGDLNPFSLLPAHARPNVSLVLLHANSFRRPSGTARLIQQVQAAGIRLLQHYHIRLDREEDFARLARSLTGNAYGLVLGGGGARGLAHAGVIHALEEAGVPIDLTGGASMGAYLAAGVAIGQTHAETLDIFLKNLVAVEKDKTIPIVSFLSGENTARILLDQIGSMDIEDLWLPFYCVSANLTRARIETHRNGPLAKSLLASSRIPGIFPPIVSDGDLLVDGGIIDNVPVDIMRVWHPCGYVIASDVSPEVDMSGIPDYGLTVSGWRALRNWLKPASRKEPLPSIPAVLLRTVEFGGAAYKALHAELADLYLRPPVGGFKIAEHQRGAEMAEIAYRYSKDRIADWLAQTSTVPQR